MNTKEEKEPKTLFRQLLPWVATCLVLIILLWSIGGFEEIAEDANNLRELEREVLENNSAVKLHRLGTDTTTEVNIPDHEDSLSRYISELWMDNRDSTGEIIVEGINFKPGTGQLTDKSIKILQQVGKALKDFPTGQLVIEGNLEDVEDENISRELAFLRSTSVENFLVGHGMNAERISFKEPIENEGKADSQSMYESGDDIYLWIVK